MPERKPNQIARVVAVVALIAVFTIVATVVLTAGGGSNDHHGGASGQIQGTASTKKGAQALRRGFWQVHEGDTLAQIALETGISVENLQQLNPQVDPHLLTTGQKVRLK